MGLRKHHFQPQRTARDLKTVPHKLGPHMVGWCSQRFFAVQGKEIRTKISDMTTLGSSCARLDSKSYTALPYWFVGNKEVLYRDNIRPTFPVPTKN